MEIFTFVQTEYLVFKIKYIGLFYDLPPNIQIYLTNEGNFYSNYFLSHQKIQKGIKTANNRVDKNIL